MNIITGEMCPSVICQRKGKAFRWQCPMTDNWIEGDELPNMVKCMLPDYELCRIEKHKVARMA